MRDEITAQNLNKKRINAKYFGNPMMDFVDKESINLFQEKSQNNIILLIGSRYPEAFNNFESFLCCLDQLNTSNKKHLIFVPLTSNANLEKIEILLISHHWLKNKTKNFSLGQESVWSKDNIFLLIGLCTFSSWVKFADVGLCNAGTATEQLVGLGIPSLSLPGKGPQFTKSFAKRQQRLLGGSVEVCNTKKILVKRLKILLQNEEVRKYQSKNGMARMGVSGGSKKIVDYLKFHL